MNNSISYSIRAYRTTKCKGTFLITEDQVSSSINTIQGFYVSYKKYIIFLLCFFWLLFPLVALLGLYYHYMLQVDSCKSKNANFQISTSEKENVEVKKSKLLGEHLLIRTIQGKNVFVYFYNPMEYVKAAEELKRIISINDIHK